MKPEQFIREFGVEKAREVVEGAPDLSLFYDLEKQKQVLKESTSIAMAFLKNRFLPIEDLKRLVESLDIISDLDGIDAAKGTLDELIKLDWDEFEHRWIDNWMCTRPRLERAIKDHESIYGGGDEVN